MKNIFLQDQGQETPENIIGTGKMGKIMLGDESLNFQICN
jgi:hypothetical protein